jgi:uncharacterized membrane protein YjgN (DUF898 family)
MAGNASADADHPLVRQPSFHGEAIPLFGLDIAKRLLGYITLGLYHFWGRTKIRTYLVNHTEFDGERFTFHGNGKELLFGWLKAMLIYGLLGFGLPFGLPLLFGTVLGSESIAAAITVVLLIGVNQLILPVILVNSRRYRMSHTSWRGIHFSFRGRVLDYLKIYVKGSLFSLLSLGIYYPFFAAHHREFMTSNTYYGDQPFGFDGYGQELFGSFLRTYLTSLGIPVLYGFLFGVSVTGSVLTLLTLGLFWLRFFAEKQRYFWDHTTFGEARFRSSITEWDYLMLKVVNALLLGVSLTFAWAWVKVRTTRFMYRHLHLDGPLDLSHIKPEEFSVSATSEGVASFLEMDFDLG